MIRARGRRFLVTGLALALAVAFPQGIAPATASAQTPSPPPSPAPGDVVSPFDAMGLDGQMKHVGYPKGSVTVLLFFLSSCPTCHRMIPEWNRAFERRPPKLNVIGVLMDQEPPGFFMATPIAVPVVRSPGRTFLAGYKVHRAPVTLRVGPGGKVEDVGVGIVDPIRLGEILRP